MNERFIPSAEFQGETKPTEPAPPPKKYFINEEIKIQQTTTVKQYFTDRGELIAPSIPKPEEIKDTT